MTHTKDNFGDLLYKDGELYLKIGWMSAGGYMQCRYKKKTYQLHRLIYEYHYGEIPAGLYIDHINRKRNDNVVENLRLVTKQENSWNNGGRGYFWSKDHGKWRAGITKDGKKKYLGLFEKEEDAREAYLKAKEEMHVIKEKTNEG